EFFLSEKPLSSDYGLAMLWRKSDMNQVKFDRLTFPGVGQLKPYEQFIEFIQRKNSDPIKRGALIGTFVLQDRTIRISNLHLDWHGGFEHRINQLKHLIDSLKPEPAHGEIICGDFNTVSFMNTKEQIQKINSLLGSEFVNAIPQFRPSTIFLQHLDHIFARNLPVKHARIHAMLGSDHYPVTASMDLVPVPAFSKNPEL
ncbi:MAG TPA: endonuclease/exonuclease/phosphatase family protein, partial [Patescibacteria group bacterium]|nr:endonuclease/exonuclease/phosphatase family protein [Patescibacteria group bacterium]